MSFDLRKDLTAGKVVAGCPFCRRAPAFHQWPGRELVTFRHDCQFVKYEAVCFPTEADKHISTWNTAIDTARANLHPTAIVVA